MSMGLPLRVNSTFFRYTVCSSNSSPPTFDGPGWGAAKLQLEDADAPTWTNDSWELAPLVMLMWLWSSKSPKYSWIAPRWLLVVVTVELFPLRGPFPFARGNFPFPLPLAERSCCCSFSNLSWISLMRFSEFSSICFSFCSKSSLSEEFRSPRSGPGFGGFFLL